MGTLGCITMPKNLQPRVVSITILNWCINSSCSGCKWGGERQKSKFVDIDGVVGVLPKDSGIYRRVTWRYMPKKKISVSMKEKCLQRFADVVRHVDQCIDSIEEDKVTINPFTHKERNLISM